NLRRSGQFPPPPALAGHRRLLYAQRLVLRPAENRRKEAGKPFPPQDPKALAQREKDQRGAGRKTPLLEKFRFQRSQSGQNQKPGPPGAGKPGPIYSAFPIFFGENHLPAADENGSLSL